ncbi:MAG TPA: exodeoxyribonuclease V subunit gamma, partial [Burkholderiaceae bacterium]|nr:exodeoxyribonuclease V subunit gamma [Burkholderiaceae bacterium]
MFCLTWSNRFEILLERLIADCANAPSDPLAPPQIVVPSAAMRRRVELGIADRHGVFAGAEFSFLAQWLWAQFSKRVPVSERSPFDPALLAWRIDPLLEDPEIASSPRLRHYLRRADRLMRFELAQRIAALFDQYVVYRPDWLQAWSAAEPAPIARLDGDRRLDAMWQSRLWRRLIEQIGAAPEHPSALFFGALQRASDGGAGASEPLDDLPAAVHVFCVPNLPPLYLQILRELAGWIDVHFYALNPCREFWFDTVDRKQLGAMAVRGTDAYREVGNELLASWGKQTQAYLGLLAGDDVATARERADFAAAPQRTLLAALQNAILDLNPLEPGSVRIADGDRSIELHVCHSLTREVEVLHDQLLAMFAADPGLRPTDVLVVTPDLERAAGAIDAVFGTAPRARSIPYRISGLRRRRTNPVARALDDALALVAGRLPANAVLDLLEQEPVARRFGLAADDIERIREWVDDAGICWGADGEHRAAFGVPPDDRHCFADGLQRLFLAYAIGDSDEPIDGRLGAGDPEGQPALALGRFWRFVDTLVALRHDCIEPKDAGGWQATLLHALESLVRADPRSIEDLRDAQRAIATLHANASAAPRTPLPFDVIRHALRDLLDDASRGAVPGGTVTFASIAGLRALPFRIVCAIGLDDGAFPSSTPPLEFDLMAADPRAGDRQRRDDERNLFLDLLLAARDRLYLSHTGRNIRDNSAIPPSVLVAELLEAASLAASDPADPASADALRRRLIVEHPLQPFSDRYFTAGGDPRCRSFDSEYFAALRNRLAASAPPPSSPAAQAIAVDADSGDEADDGSADDAAGTARSGAFFAAALPPPPAELRRVDLQRLLWFFNNPCRGLLQQRLRIAMPQLRARIADVEPMRIERLVRSRIASRLLRMMLQGRSDAEVRAAA